MLHIPISIWCFIGIELFWESILIDCYLIYLIMFPMYMIVYSTLCDLIWVVLTVNISWFSNMHMIECLIVWPSDPKLEAARGITV